MNHFVQGRGDQAAQTDHVRLGLPGRLKDTVAPYHHTQVHDLVSVALQYHRDDALADVVHVSLHSRKDDFPLEK